jgi:heme-degrading monooxygenase HmoA
MFLVLWEFEVKPGCEERFEKVYGPGGDWDSLFRRDPHHAGTHLFRDSSKPHLYLTADYWISRESYETFRRTSEAEYKQLDSVSEALTASERQIGSYETVVTPPGKIAHP